MTDTPVHGRVVVKSDQDVVGAIRTYTGKMVTPMNMQPDMFDIEDIAHSLSRACRYLGHVDGFMSVAEHAVRVSYRVETAVFNAGGNRATARHYALTGLLHDVDEAYLPDLPSPLKRLPEMATYLATGERIQEAAFAVFGAIWPMPHEVHVADKDDLWYEIENLRFQGGGLLPDAAEALFLARYEELRIK